MRRRLGPPSLPVTAAQRRGRLDSGRHGVWRSLVAHPLWERGAVGSNPATPTFRGAVGSHPATPTDPATTSLDSWADPASSSRPAPTPADRHPRSTAAVKSTIEELGPTRVRMAIEVPWGDLDHAFGEVYKELGKQVRIPGFRPGKVPNRILDQRLGRPVVLEQVVQHAIPEVYSEVVRENQVRVLGQPDIEVTRLDDNDTLAFTAEVD